MFRKMLIVLALFAAAGTAVAEPSKGKGFYLVGAAGESVYDEGSSFGNLGIGTVDIDVSGGLNADESMVAGGIGFRWYPTPNFAIGIQTDAYVWDENNEWASGVGATQLSLQGHILTGVTPALDAQGLYQ